MIEAEQQLDKQESGDGMLLNDEFDQEQFLLDMIDEEDYEMAGENRDTMLVERDTTILNTIR